MNQSNNQGGRQAQQTGGQRQSGDGMGLSGGLNDGDRSSGQSEQGQPGRQQSPGGEPGANSEQGLKGMRGGTAMESEGQTGEGGPREAQLEQGEADRGQEDEPGEYARDRRPGGGSDPSQSGRY